MALYVLLLIDAKLTLDTLTTNNTEQTGWPYKVPIYTAPICPGCTVIYAWLKVVAKGITPTRIEAINKVLKIRPRDLFILGSLLTKKRTIPFISSFIQMYTNAGIALYKIISHTLLL